jgi:flagellar protein FlbB
MYSDQGYSRVGAAPRIFGLTLLVLFLAIGGALWFDFLGLIDVTHLVAPVLRWFNLEPREEGVAVDDPLLLATERLEKREQALAITWDELSVREQSLDSRELELDAVADQLRELDAALQDRENSVNQRLRQVENERAALVRLSTYLTNMPPVDAVEIMVNYSDPILLDVLLVTDELAEEAGAASLVPYWLSLMPAERAAAISEKLEMLPEIDDADQSGGAE